MSDNDEYEITIYRNGAQVVLPVHGGMNFLRQRMFLDRLVGKQVRE